MKAKQKYILVKLPRYGLCNKLITWAKAYNWSKKNEADLIVEGWTHLPIGSILRGDKSWRWYQGFFKKSSLLTTIILSLKKKTVINNIQQPAGKHRFFTYKGTPYVSDLIELAPYRDQIRHAFYQIVKPKHLKQANQIESPYIGVHIRRGDYVKIGSALNLDYYIKVIGFIRSIQGSDLPVTLFSDGYPSELEPVLNLKSVTLFPTKNDLVDLLVLSKSRILVTSLGSSYSYWAAFLSDDIVLHHPKTWVPQCRPSKVNQYSYEGTFDPSQTTPELLIENLQQIHI